jgi:hypothetical protein
VSFQNPPVYTGSAETDIIYQKGTLPGGLLGQTLCDNAVNTQLCDQHYVVVSTDTPDTRLVCHESGHGVGLTHGQQAAPRLANGDNSLGCMQDPNVEIPNGLLGTHNTQAINSAY